MTGVVCRVFQRELKMDMILASAKWHFFNAMGLILNGDIRAINVPGNRGHSQFIYAQDDFHVIDKHEVIGGKSVVSTTIWYLGKPIWIMTRVEQFLDEDRPFITKILSDTYRMGAFIGGRGPESRMLYGSLVYENKPEPGSDFENFAGTEFVCGSRPQGGGHYWGMRVRSPLPK